MTKTKFCVSVFMLLFLITFGTANAQVSNTQANFSCPGQVTVTYDLNTDCETDVILYYSHNKRDWLPAAAVTGDITAQTSGTGKTIIWNNYADNVRFGKFYFKVEAQPCEFPECVMIGDVCWATCNVDLPGTFAAHPEDYGMFYQWNRNIGWSNTNPPVSTNGSAWNSAWNGGGATTWQAANNVCPAGYRVPTPTEYQNLVDAGNVWTTRNGVNGCEFGSGANTIFIPAAGRIRHENGLFEWAGLYGYGWANAVFGAGSSHLFFSNSTIQAQSSDPRALGYSVRCVAE